MLGRVVRLRQVGDRTQAVPFVLAGVAGDREQAVPTVADRRRTGGDPADVAVDVGVRHVQCGNLPMASSFTNSFAFFTRSNRNDGRYAAAPGSNADPAERERAVAFLVVMNDRPVLRELQFHFDRRGFAFHADLLANDFDRFPLVAVAVLASGRSGSSCSTYRSAWSVLTIVKAQAT